MEQLFIKTMMSAPLISTEATPEVLDAPQSQAEPHGGLSHYSLLNFDAKGRLSGRCSMAFRSCRRRLRLTATTSALAPLRIPMSVHFKPVTAWSPAEAMSPKSSAASLAIKYTAATPHHQHTAS